MTEENKDDDRSVTEEGNATEPTFVDKANEAAARMEEANKKTEELLVRQEKLEAHKVLGGKAEAGSVAEKEISAEKKKVNDAAEYFEGTQLEQDIKKANE